MSGFGESPEPLVNSYVSLVAARADEARQRIAHAQKLSGAPQVVTLVAVTKTYGVDAVQAAWACGIADIGENKVQEAEGKMNAIALPVRWHLIGHLQRNKARQAVRFNLIHSIDSYRLALAVNETAAAANRVQPVLVQVNVSEEATKGGFATSDVAAFADQLSKCNNLSVTGVMTMAPFNATEAVLRTVFAGARNVAEQLRVAGHPATELSMGMSGDFEIAVQEGATLVRLGTVLFGNRASS